MGDLTKNISRHEIACNCECELDTIDHETVEVVQECCDHFAQKMGLDRVVLVINSGSRCMEYNLSIGSSTGSWHPKCRAIDFKIIGVSPKDVWEYLNKKYPHKYGIGEYSTFTHLDSRPDPARWGHLQ